MPAALLPAGVAKYSETPVFTEETVPAKLTSIHRTKPGVWGRLCVISGALEYAIPEDGGYRNIVHGGEYDIIRPAQPHHVTILGPVEFKVEFYR